MFSNSAQRGKSANLNDKDSTTTKEELKAAKERGSVASNIAMFQANIDAQSAHSRDNLSNNLQTKKKNIFAANRSANRSDISSNLGGGGGRDGSVKSLIMKFNT